MTQLPGGNFFEIMLIMNDDDKKSEAKSRRSVRKSQKMEGKLEPESQENNKPEDSGGTESRLKSKGRKIIIGLIISLSAVMFGYSVKQITSVDIDVLVAQYNITLDKFIAQSILIGVLPIASIIGAVITRALLKRFKRLSGIYVFALVNCGAIGIVNINIFGALVAGRFLEGICVGFYSAIAPIYLKEIAPKELRKMLGLFFSFGKILGVLISIIVELIVVQALNISFAYRIILSLTAPLSVLQAVLIFFFGSDTPTEMIERGNIEGAKQILKEFYHPKHVEEVLEEYSEEYQASQIDVNESQVDDDRKREKKKRKRNRKRQTLEQSKEKSLPKKQYLHSLEVTKSKVKPEEEPEEDEPSYYQSQFDVKASEKGQDQSQSQGSESNQTDSSQKPKLTFDQKRQKAYCLGVHLAGVRNFIGANALITQGGILVKMFNYGLGKYTSLIINSVQFISIIFGLVYVQSVLGKKPLFIISIPTLSILNFALVVAMIYENVPAMLMIMCIYMAIYGVAFISPIWAYPSEVIPAAEQLPANILHWLSLAFSMLVPPLVSSVMPGNNPYPVFVFFGIYGLIAFVHVRLTLRETNGLTYKQIIDSFK